VARWLVSAAEAPAGVESSDFWHRAAIKLISPYLLAAALNGADMARVIQWLDNQEVDEVAEILGSLGPPAALRAANANWRREDKSRSSIFTTGEILLDAYADPNVAASAERSDIHPDTLLDGGAHTLYISAPGDDQDQLRPLFGALVHQVLAAVGRRAAGGKPVDPPLLVVLDEAANIAQLRNLDALASTAAGLGVQLVTVWQDLAQIEARYGRRAQTILNNHRGQGGAVGYLGPGGARLRQPPVRRRGGGQGLDHPRRRRAAVEHGVDDLPPAGAGRRAAPGRPRGGCPGLRPPAAGPAPASPVVRGLEVAAAGGDGAGGGDGR
jgi:hypothetical protein